MNNIFAKRRSRLLAMKALRERYGLECVPIPGESLHLYCITRRGDRQREEVARYIKLLEGELDEA